MPDLTIPEFEEKTTRAADTLIERLERVRSEVGRDVEPTVTPRNQRLAFLAFFRKLLGAHYAVIPPR